MTDPAVEALAEVLWLCGANTGPWDDEMNDEDDRDWMRREATAALDHIAAHLHADTPEGAALRERLGLSEETVDWSAGIRDEPYVQRRVIGPWRGA